MQVHISRNGQQFGPYTVEQVNEYLRSGHLLLTDLAWYPGAAGWGPLGDVPGIEPVLQPENSSLTAPQRSEASVPTSLPVVEYHHVSKLKFVLLSLVSLGAYHIFWFYRCWRFVQERDRSTIRPFWRALFCPLWCGALIKDMRTQGYAIPDAAAVLIPLTYFMLSISWRLAEPYQLITLFSFVPLLSVVGWIDQMNRLNRVIAPYHSRIGAVPAVLSVFGAVLLLSTVLESFRLIPSTHVLPGTRLSPKELQFLRSSEILGEDESVLFFYSGSLFSIHHEGVVLTNLRILSYEAHAAAEDLVIDGIRFADIEDIRVEPGPPGGGQTVVRLRRGEGEDELEISLSTEEGGDRQLVERLKALWRDARPTPPPPQGQPE